MSVRYFAEKVIKYFNYILCEKDELIPGSYSLKDVQSAFQKERLRKYSWTESNGEIHIRKKSIVFPASHYLALTIEHEGLRCRIKMKSIERAMLIVFLSIILSVVIATPILVVATAFTSIDKHNLVVVAPILLILSIALMVWLKLICFVLAYISGVAKIPGWLKRSSTHPPQ